MNPMACLPFLRLTRIVPLMAALVVFTAAGAGAGHKDRGVPAPAKRAAEEVGKETAQEATKGGIVVTGPWARASAGRARNGAAYFTVRNKGAQADRLIAVQTPMAKKARLHTHLMSGGVMRMREVKGGLAIQPGGKLSFAPRRYHVMLMGLGKPLKAGDGFPLTLIFERAGRITVRVRVHPLGGPAPMPMPRHK